MRLELRAESGAVLNTLTTPAQALQQFLGELTCAFRVALARVAHSASTVRTSTST